MGKYLVAYRWAAGSLTDRFLFEPGPDSDSSREADLLRTLIGLLGAQAPEIGYYPVREVSGDGSRLLAVESARIREETVRDIAQKYVLEPSLPAAIRRILDRVSPAR
jgi:hypothetical protein